MYVYVCVCVCVLNVWMYVCIYEHTTHTRTHIIHRFVTTIIFGIWASYLIPKFHEMICPQDELTVQVLKISPLKVL